jgi:hypothetical protein
MNKRIVAEYERASAELGGRILDLEDLESRIAFLKGEVRRLAQLMQTQETRPAPPRPKKQEE